VDVSPQPHTIWEGPGHPAHHLQQQGLHAAEGGSRLNKPAEALKSNLGAVKGRATTSAAFEGSRRRQNHLKLAMDSSLPSLCVFVGGA
jgi:hypothetical protein